MRTLLARSATKIQAETIATAKIRTQVDATISCREGQATFIISALTSSTNSTTLRQILTMKFPFEVFSVIASSGSCTGGTAGRAGRT